MPSLFGPLEFGELITRLEETNKTDLPKDSRFYGRNDHRCVYFDWCMLNPLKFYSYRGFYDHLALGFGINTPSIMIKTFLGIMKNSVGDEFVGYEGSVYRILLKTPVWVANKGDCTQIGIVDVRDSYGHVELVTQKFYD